MSSNNIWPHEDVPRRLVPPAAKKAPARKAAARTATQETRRPQYNFEEGEVELASKDGTVELHSDQMTASSVSIRGETHFQMVLKPGSAHPHTVLCNKYGDILSSSDPALMTGEFCFRKPTVDISFYPVRNQNLKGRTPELIEDAYATLEAVMDDYQPDLKHVLRLSIPYDGSRPFAEIIDVPWPKKD